MKVAITGVSGRLGQRVLARLDADPAVRSIVGLDVAEPARGGRKLAFHRCDLTTADLKPLLEGTDIVVHLAGVVGPVADVHAARRLNVDGTRRLLDAASAVSARRFVRAASATVYGAWPNNPLPLTEDAPLRPNPGYLPAMYDAECERLLAEWSDQHPSATAVSLRLAPVVGPGIESLFAAAAAGRAPVRVRGSERAVQVVHVDDAASALALAVAGELDGAYNVAATGWLTAADADAVAAPAHRPALPPELAERTLRTMWKSGLGDAPAAALPYFVHPWVMANDKLRAAGWEPRHSNEEAIVLSGNSDGARSPLPWIAAVGAVLTGVAGTTIWLQRSRRR